MARSVMWFRRDLRVADHPALVAAAAAGEVVPLFVVDPIFTARAGAPRRAFMAAVLDALDGEIGGELVYRHGDPAVVVPEFAEEVGAGTVFVTKDFAPYGRRRDATVSERLAGAGRVLRGVGSNYAVEPGRVTRADGGGYGVFSPFKRAWEQVGWDAPSGEPRVRWAGRSDVRSDDPPASPPTATEIPPGASAHWHRRWERFVEDGLDRYDARRNLPAQDGTSRMSMALRWGIVHPRQLLADLGSSRSHERFRSELAWRDFYADVLFRRPESARESLQEKMAAMPFDTGPEADERFAAWQQGRTGFPIVDAGMRQLLALGWMHNRVRMIVASFLVKDLHVAWQRGARHFHDHLIDGDLASNNHGWQWTAGTGTDPAPFFRIFNPWTQSERFDPDGDYIRRWVPELAGVSAPQIHTPGAARPAEYPAPIVDHAAERRDALARYAAVNGASR